ncbi:MAG TPA: hypothetical protein VKD24_07535 [Candidatus Angelobacter sp.]|nr:hypothetical protein [Candidatus Angelobacter sp.]
MKNLTTETGKQDRVTGAGDQAMRCPPAPITLSGDHQITRSTRLANIRHILLVALREIFDENAYEHFLARNRVTRSAASYREFLREREAVIARLPRCC